MKKPIIGVMPLWDKEKDSLWMLPRYLDSITLAGGIPIIFPFSSDEEEIRQIMKMCGGFLFTGGPDVDPEIYNEEPMEEFLDRCPKRDLLESIALKEAIAEDKPVLGICRGIQVINAVLGGTLYQDLPTQHPSKIAHRQQPPYDVPSHSVAIVTDSPLQKCLEVEQLTVNSCHHQAVKTVAPDLSVMAVSEDGLIEAVYRPDSRFLWAVQWHPEFFTRTDEQSRRIFKAFVDAI